MLVDLLMVSVTARWQIIMRRGGNLRARRVSVYIDQDCYILLVEGDDEISCIYSEGVVI